MEDSKKMSKRLIWLDIIKILGAFLIVLQHSISMEWIRQIDSHENLDFLFNFIYMISRGGVPLFFMASGLGMLGKDRSIENIFKKNILSLLKVYVCWMLIYGVLAAAKSSTWQVGAREVVKSVIFGHYHTWFIAALLALYLIIPFLDRIVSDTVLTRYFIILSIIFTFIVPMITGYIKDERLEGIFTDMDMHFVVGYVVYFVAGYYLGNLEITQKKRLVSGMTFILSLVLTGIYSYYKSLSIGTECQNYYAPLSLMGFVMAASFFYFVRSLMDGPMHEGIGKKAITYVSEIGVGIYLMHPLFLTFVDNVTGLPRLVAAAAIYLVSLFIAIVISTTPLKKILLK